MDNKASEEVVETVEALKAERDQLKSELERLHCELAQTSHEKIQSAQYGLVLLDEKQVLQSKCEELETLYDTTKHELDLLKEAFAKSQTSQKVSASTGIEQEQTLLQESASREASLTCTLQDAERELKQVRQELERVNHEKERYLSENTDLLKQCEIFEWEKRTLKGELKELKAREARLLSDNNELEEENISLQKQVSSLRSSQVEFEGAKHEVRRLQEEVESLNAQVEELTSLKHIAEKQLEEALEALQSEREQKYAFKKELDAKANSESLFSLNNLTFAGFRLGSKPNPTSGSLESCFYGKTGTSTAPSTVVSSVKMVRRGGFNFNESKVGGGGTNQEKRHNLTSRDQGGSTSGLSELELCGCICLCCCSIVKLVLDGFFALFSP